MIALLTGILGVFSSLVPEFIKLRQDSRDKAHELEIMRMQIEAQKAGVAAKVDEVELNSMATQAVALQQSYRAELKYTGAFSASVRPTITYAMFLLYAVQKVVVLYCLIHNPLPWHEGAGWVTAALTTWTAFDEGLLGAVIGFWFGGRMTKK